MPAIAVEVLTGSMDGLGHYRPGGELVIGRGPGAALSLPHDPRVAPRHARLRWSGARLLLEDLGSPGGTWIGARRLREPIAVSPGVVFAAGGTLIEILDADAPT